MNWYTLENGTLCLGTEQDLFANFHAATEWKLDTNLFVPLTLRHVGLIGSHPEDWYLDNKINDKINEAAKEIFKYELIEYQSKAVISDEMLNSIIGEISIQQKNYADVGLTQITQFI